MGRRLRAFSVLSWRDKRRLLTCTALLSLIHAALALAGYRRTRALIERLTRRRTFHPASASEIEDARALARLASIAGRHGPVEATCLRQALLLTAWLQRKGLQPTLQLGVPQQAHAGFQAHAWVELDGARLLDSDVGFKSFKARLP